MKCIKTIQNFAHKNNLWKKGDSFVIGVSGGPDSMCLLSIFNALKEKYDFRLHIAHVNYHLRGEESDKDEALVRKLGEKYGIGVTVYNSLSCQGDVVASAGEAFQLSNNTSPHKSNLEEKQFLRNTPPHASASLFQRGITQDTLSNSINENSLRTIRYDFFEELRKNLEFDYIAVGHNMNDQAETLLLHLIRGAGLQGLSGMLAKNNRIIRPLLNTTREEILAFLTTNNIPYRIDVTNNENLFTRNKIRNIILPLLADINPNIIQTLANTAETLGVENDFLEEEIMRTFKKDDDRSPLHGRRLGGGFPQEKNKKDSDLEENFIDTPSVSSDSTPHPYRGGDTKHPAPLQRRKLQFSRSTFLALHKAQQRRFLMRTLETFGITRNITTAQLLELTKMLNSGKSKAQTILLHGLKYEAKGDIVTILKVVD